MIRPRQTRFQLGLKFQCTLRENVAASFRKTKNTAMGGGAATAHARPAPAHISGSGLISDTDYFTAHPLHRHGPDATTLLLQFRRRMPIRGLHFGVPINAHVLSIS